MTDLTSHLFNRGHSVFFWQSYTQFCCQSKMIWIRADKGKFRKISRREISSVKKTLSKNPHSTSAKIFHEAGVPSRSRAADGARS